MSDNTTGSVADVKHEETADNIGNLKVDLGAKAPEAAKPVSPAQDLRDIQYLLLNGIFPGNVAPSVVKSYHLLEQMASQVEKEASVEKK